MLAVVYNSPSALNNKDLHSFFSSCCIFYNLSFINTIDARYIDLGFVTLINNIYCVCALIVSYNCVLLCREGFLFLPCNN
jgi:hypothetical protein